MPLRVVYMGTPDYAVPTLRAIADAGHDIAAVYCQPPRPAGRRGLELTPSPVHREAERLGLLVRTPVSLKSPEAQAEFAALQADVAAVVAYGLLLPRAVLDAPRLGSYNGHASLLPRWRGAAPIQRSIMAGDAETGVMIMKMDVGLDTGPVALTRRIAISPDMTSGELHERLSHLTAEAMADALALLEAGDLPLVPQAQDGVTYASKIDKAETRIDWSRPAAEIQNRIRGLSPSPGAWAEIGGERVKLLSSTLADVSGRPGEVLDGNLTIACGNGGIRPVILQRAGGKPMPASDFLRGSPISKGTIFP